ncbi:2-dehydro-3-deoxy-D-gluconate 5-dehydrogenase KduD [Devosia sp. YIM 151766]|uniref:2-dehydro-3-deoxy-D-gluconate 5-dehydrogenase KduD n=1 Tax=Devosia sp. YIM 151766 TaxID=3017325 RepID=UPI00255C8047|nr:2-dehydro-3-deoxy-D-gluconate 5-dehydrogenase KduD [Devosia sp. YIM 151766]WIY52153.1 2-dehydro-3-deoxy-D-gluconate 5-dehydrogenase KduD [Devosia sp. YIM 151766]
MIDLSAFSLEGKTIMVTGANTGIGQGIALAVVRAGGRVLAAGRSNMDDTSRQAAALSHMEAPITPIFADLDPLMPPHAMLDAAWDAHGPIHGLVNNAGIIRRADALDFTEEDWDDVMGVNLKAAFFLCQAFARRVVQTPGATGKIVNIASMLSFQGGIRVASYTASKSGIMGLTRLLACEWAQKGINVNAIAPGYIETNNTEALRNDPDRNTQILGRIPAGRWGEPSDIGDAAVFLLASASNYMHGATIPVDGGWLAR